MPTLLERDRRAVLDAAAVLSECTDHAEFALCGAEQLRLLLHAEVAAFTYVDLRSRRVEVLLNPDVPEYLGPVQHASRTLCDNPLPTYWASSQTPGPSRVSDHLNRRAWLATSTYADVLKPMGTPHMLGVPLEDAARGGPSCAVSRSGRDFSARDVDLAGALQTALFVLHRRLVARRTGTPDALTGSPVLTARETEVLVLLSAGRTAQSIARTLAISPGTVRKHLEHLYRKLEVQDRLSAVDRGRRLGLLQDGVRREACAGR